MTDAVRPIIASHDVLAPEDVQSLSGDAAKDILPKTPAVLLEISDLCAVFQRDPRSIRRWIKAGHLHPIRVGRSLFFDSRDIQALIAKRLRR